MNETRYGADEGEKAFDNPTTNEMANAFMVANIKRYGGLDSLETQSGGVHHLDASGHKITHVTDNGVIQSPGGIIAEFELDFDNRDPKLHTRVLLQTPDGGSYKWEGDAANSKPPEWVKSILHLYAVEKDRMQKMASEGSAQ